MGAICSIASVRAVNSLKILSRSMSAVLVLVHMRKGKNLIALDSHKVYLNIPQILKKLKTT